MLVNVVHNNFKFAINCFNCVIATFIFYCKLKLHTFNEYQIELDDMPPLAQAPAVSPEQHPLHSQTPPPRLPACFSRHGWRWKNAL